MNELELRALYQKLITRRSDRGRARCPSPEEIVALAEISLTESERLRLLTHVSACSFCQQDLSVARAVALTRRPPARRIGGWVGLAAAATVLAVAVLVWRPTGGGDSPVMRGGTDGVTLVRPAGAVATSDTVFTWRGVPGATRYHIEVLTGAGALIHSAETADTTLAVRRGMLTPQEYFWRVTASLGDGSSRSSAATRFEVR